MYNIKTLNKISTVGLSRLGSDYTYGDDVQNPDAILVRSASMHEMDMPESLLAIARAGAGVNNIPLDKCSEQGIVVFNTPGANANAVKELVIAGLLLSSRKITAGIEWAKTLKGNGDAVGKMVEKGKSQFAGYDPFLSVDGALQLSRHVKHVTNLDEVFADSDYITVHVPLTPDTKNIICAENIAKMKDGVRILNYSRADLCNSEDVLAAIESGKVSTYVTDFATDNLLGVDGVIAMPHLGASTPESEDNCARMAADEIKDYLENGNITHSVNFPAAKMARTGDVRYCVLHKNVPAVLQSVLSFVSQQGANVENMENKSRKDYAYTIIDVTGASADLTDSIKGVDGVIRVRVIK